MCKSFSLTVAGRYLHIPLPTPLISYEHVDLWTL